MNTPMQSTEAKREARSIRYAQKRDARTLKEIRNLKKKLAQLPAGSPDALKCRLTLQHDASEYQRLREEIEYCLVDPHYISLVGPDPVALARERVDMRHLAHTMLMFETECRSESLGTLN